MAVADGVGWGDAARRAARCAVLGVMDHLHRQLQALSGHRPPGGEGAPPPRRAGAAALSSTEVFREMVASLQPAQDLILRQMGTLTTLVLSVVLRQSPQCAHHPHNRSRGGPSQSLQSQQSASQRLQQRHSGLAPPQRRSESGTAGTRAGSVSSSGAVAGSAIAPAAGGAGSVSGLQIPDWLKFGSGGSASSGAAPQLPTTWVAMTLTVGDSVAWVWRAPPPSTTLAQLQQLHRRHREAAAAAAGGDKPAVVGGPVWGGRVQELTAASHEGQVRCVGGCRILGARACSLAWQMSAACLCVCAAVWRRDVRFVPGALGYAQGEDADLSNLTLSLTVLKPGRQQPARARTFLPTRLSTRGHGDFPLRRRRVARPPGWPPRDGRTPLCQKEAKVNERAHVAGCPCARRRCRCCCAGDIVFLASDGVADNFDPVMLKQARHAEHAAMEVSNARTARRRTRLVLVQVSEQVPGPAPATHARACCGPTGAGAAPVGQRQRGRRRL